MYLRPNKWLESEKSKAILACPRCKIPTAEIEPVRVKRRLCDTCGKTRSNFYSCLFRAADWEKPNF